MILFVLRDVVKARGCFDQNDGAPRVSTYRAVNDAPSIPKTSERHLDANPGLREEEIGIVTRLVTSARTSA